MTNIGNGKIKAERFHCSDVFYYKNTLNAVYRSCRTVKLIVLYNIETEEDSFPQNWTFPIVLGNSCGKLENRFGEIPGSRRGRETWVEFDNNINKQKKYSVWQYSIWQYSVKFDNIQSSLRIFNRILMKNDHFQGCWEATLQVCKWRKQKQWQVGQVEKYFKTLKQVEIYFKTIKQVEIYFKTGWNILLNFKTGWNIL